MLIEGYDDELGFNPFKKVASAAKKVGGTAFKVATFPTRTAYKYVAKPVLKETAAVGGTLIGTTLRKTAGALMPSASAAPSLPACGFFQRLARFFGGTPSCE